MQHLACRESEFGQGCIQQCLCQNGALCNAVNGACTCTAGYTGVNCEIGKIKTLLLYNRFLEHLWVVNVTYM